MNQNFKFPKDNRLLSKSDFLNLKKESHFCRSGSLIAFHKDNDFSKARIGFAVSKKIGNAVKRNKVKRVFREIFRKSDFRNLSKDILIAFNLKNLKSKNELDYSKLSNDFEKLLKGLK